MSFHILVMTARAVKSSIKPQLNNRDVI